MGRARGSGAGLGATTNSGFSGGPVLSTRGPNAGGLEDGLAAALYSCWCSSGPRLGLGAQPTVEQVQKNLFGNPWPSSGVLYVLHSQVQSGGVLHTVVMFDEIATKKRVHWDPKTNYFLGVCRQHAQKTLTEFVNEGDLEELYQNLDDGVVHYAAEVSMF